MWFKNGLKSQKLQKQHALKGQKLLAPRATSWELWTQACRPERAEAPSPGQRPGYNSSLQDAL